MLIHAYPCSDSISKSSRISCTSCFGSHFSGRIDMDFWEALPAIPAHSSCCKLSTCQVCQVPIAVPICQVSIWVNQNFSRISTEFVNLKTLKTFWNDVDSQSKALPIRRARSRWHATADMARFRSRFLQCCAIRNQQESCNILIHINTYYTNVFDVV